MTHDYPTAREAGRLVRSSGYNALGGNPRDWVLIVIILRLCTLQVHIPTLPHSTTTTTMSETTRLKSTVFVGTSPPFPLLSTLLTPTGGLDNAVTKEILHSAFLPFGDIAEVQLPRDERSTDPHRGFGYVEFEQPADALAAIDNMDQSMLAGRVLNVAQAKPQKEGTVLGSKVAVWEQVWCIVRIEQMGRY